MRACVNEVDPLRRVCVFLGDDKGSESIQLVLWVPLFVFLLVIVTDASILYLNHTEMWNVARDTARRMAAGQLTSAADAESYAAGQLTMHDNPYQVTATHDPIASMEVVISVGIADAMIFGAFLGPVLGNTVQARVVMRSEPAPVAVVGGGT